MSGLRSGRGAARETRTTRVLRESVEIASRTRAGRRLATRAVAVALGAAIVLLVPVPGAGARAESDADRIRAKSGDFLPDLIRAEYDHFGRGEPAGFARVHQRFGYLFNPRKAAELANAVAGAGTADGRRALLLLQHFVEAEHVAGHVAALRDEMLDYELAQVLDVPRGGQRSFRSAVTDLERESDRSLRKILYVAATDVHSSTNVFKLQILADMGAEARVLGYPDLPAMLAAHQGLDFAQLSDLSTRLLAETDSAYTTLLAARARDVLDLAAADVRRYDLDYLAQPVELNPALAQAAVVDLFAGGVSSRLRLGFDSKVVAVQVVDAPGAVASGVYPIEPGRSILVASRPRGAAADLVFTFEGLGRSEVYSSLRTPQFEFRRLEREAAALAAGYLIAGLLGRPAFATSVLKLSPADAERLRKALLFRELVGLRHDAASFLYELDLMKDPAAAQTRYNEHMEKYLKVAHIKIDEERYLEDFTFEAASRLAGRLLAAHLAAVLRQRFGESWWESAAAGALLTGLWAPGSREPLAAQAAELGFSLTDASPLVEAFNPGPAGS